MVLHSVTVCTIQAIVTQSEALLTGFTGLRKAFYSPLNSEVLHGVLM